MTKNQQRLPEEKNVSSSKVVTCLSSDGESDTTGKRPATCHPIGVVRVALQLDGDGDNDGKDHQDGEAEGRLEGEAKEEDYLRSQSLYPLTGALLHLPAAHVDFVTF